MRTRRLARTTASIGLVLLAGALAAGPVSAQQQDVIGIWFDAGARQDSIATTVSGEEVTAYLAILNPSVAFAISGWECRVEVAGEGIAVEEWELAEGLNIDEPPSFQVGIERYHELIAAPVVVLARVRLTVAGPQSRGWLYVHPYHPASLQDPPGSGHPRPVCVYAPTADPSDLKPLAWASGSEAWPVAVINPGEAGPVCHAGTDALRFGFVALGEAREEPLALVNVGGAPFAGEVAAPADPAFSLAAGGGAFVLGPGERRDIVVRYAPAAAGPDTAGLAACAEVLLAGGAYEAGSCGVTPQALDFGEVRQGEESCLGFTVANASDRFVAGRVDEVAPPFRLASGGGEFFLAPGESRDVVVCFAPAAMAPAFGSVTVSSCGAQVALQGMGGEALPRCVVAPPRLDFGSLVAGQAAELSFSIRNDGGYRLNGTVGALAVPFAVVAGGGAFSLAAQESLAVTVRYAPIAPGQHSAGLGLGTDQCGPVVCTGGVPRCALSTTALDFGAVGLGDVGSRSLTIRNSGGGVLEGEVELSAPPFALPAAPGGRLPYRLAAGAAMAIQVSYTPPEIAAHEATLQAGGACGPVALRGSGVEPQPVCQVSPAALEFGSVTVGTAAERLITIRNAGTGLMSGNVHAECEAFSLVDGGGEFTVGGGQSHVARVRFTPTGHGEARCTVALGTHGCFDVQARGTGLAPLCRLAPAALDFGGVAVGEARSRSFVVSNVGSLPLGGTIALASPDFSLALGGGAFTLQPGQQRTVSVRFQPTGPGAKAGAVETGLGACGTLPCAGTADHAICAIAPEALDFGVVRLGQAADSGFTVTNTGTVPFTAAVSSSSDEFRVAGIGFWLTLDPGASRFIGVVCEPESAGAKTAAIRLGTGWREVACTGFGRAHV